MHGLFHDDFLFSLANDCKPIRLEQMKPSPGNFANQSRRIGTVALQSFSFASGRSLPHGHQLEMHEKGPGTRVRFRALFALLCQAEPFSLIGCCGAYWAGMAPMV